MGPFDAFLERPGFGGSTPAIGKSRAIVLDPNLQPVVFDSQADIDPVGVAMAYRIGDRLSQHLLQIELKPDRDRALITVRGNVAVDGPVLALSLGKRAKLGDRIRKLELAVAPQGEQEAANLRLLLD